MSAEMLQEGEKGIAVRKDQRGLYSVIECSIKTGFHGTRRYGSTVGTIKYKTESGAKKALKVTINERLRPTNMHRHTK